LEGETEEERFERAQKEAGIEKKEFQGDEEDTSKLFIVEGELLYLYIVLFSTAKKPPAKPVESIKPRTRADFEELKKLLINIILEKKASFYISN
jgi:translation initiation factor 3 subunit J